MKSKKNNRNFVLKKKQIKCARAGDCAPRTQLGTGVIKLPHSLHFILTCFILANFSFLSLIGPRVLEVKHSTATHLFARRAAHALAPSFIYHNSIMLTYIIVGPALHFGASHLTLALRALSHLSAMHTKIIRRRTQTTCAVAFCARTIEIFACRRFGPVLLKPTPCTFLCTFL